MLPNPQAEYWRAVSENVELVRRGYEAFDREDIDGILPLLDQQVEWRNPEDSPIAGVWHGHKGVRDWFALTREVYDEMRFRPDEFKELPDGRILVLLHAGFKAKQSGIEMKLPFAHLITIRTGLVTHLQMYTDQQRAWEAAGLQAPG